MPIPYPDWLPLAQKSKTPSTDTGFRTDQPTVGAPIFQKLTDDLKTSFSLTWIFTRDQHRAFMQWMRSPNYLDNGNQWFTMPVGTGTGDTGVEVQELHFLAWPTWSQSGSVFTWSGDVISRKLVNSDDEFDDIIVELPPPWDSWLDIVVTGYPDNRDPESLPKIPMAWFNYRDKSLGYGLQLTRASAATYIDNGVLKSAAANAPRYENNGLLIEVVSTNLTSLSEGWPASAGAKGSNAWVHSPPDSSGWITVTGGTDTGSGEGSYRNFLSGTAAQNKTATLSIDVKKVAGYNFMIRAYVGGAGSDGLGVAGAEFADGKTLPTGSIWKIQDNGTWLRISLTRKFGDGTSIFRLYPFGSQINASGALTYRRVQVEALPLATSHIKTSGVAATRQPDQLSLIESGAKNLYREYIPLGTPSLIKELIPYTGELVPLNSHLRILKVWDRELTDAEKAAFDF